jgi:hypothetical protein
MVPAAAVASDVDVDTDDEGIIPGIVRLSENVNLDHISSADPTPTPRNADSKSAPLNYLPFVEQVLVVQELEEKKGEDVNSYDPGLPFNSRHTGVNATIEYIHFLVELDKNKWNHRYPSIVLLRDLWKDSQIEKRTRGPYERQTREKEEQKAQDYFISLD